MSSRHALVERGPVRSALIVGIFVAGFLGGAIGYLAAQPGTPPAKLPASAPGFVAAAEPDVARAVIADMVNGDAYDLAKLVKSTDLTDLQTAVAPLVDISAIDFVSASRLGDQELAAYLARGKTSAGQKVVRGFFLRVQNGQIVGIN